MMRYIIPIYSYWYKGLSNSAVGSQRDKEVPAEWHFYATSYRKGPCDRDGVGETVKRLAARASLQRTCDKQILTPRQLYKFDCSDIPSVNFHYTTIEEHQSQSALLNERFELSRTIAGTHRLHSFRPLSINELEVKILRPVF